MKIWGDFTESSLRILLILLPSAKELPVNFGLLTRKKNMWVWTHPNRLLRETIFRSSGCACPSNIYTR